MMNLMPKAFSTIQPTGGVESVVVGALHNKIGKIITINTEITLI